MKEIQERSVQKTPSKKEGMTEEKEITINLLLMNGTNVEVKAPDQMCIEDALEQLVENHLMPVMARELSYTVCSKEQDVRYDITRTFAENGIEDGDVLRVVACAYGCPTVKELPGIVPACMLTKGGEAEYVEL